MFKKEVEAYRRLAGSSDFPRFYGAFRGIGFTGLDTGLVILEKLKRPSAGNSEQLKKQEVRAKARGGPYVAEQCWTDGFNLLWVSSFSSSSVGFKILTQSGLFRGVQTSLNVLRFGE